MDYYPQIATGQNPFEPPSWAIEPIVKVSHSGITGLMEHRDSLSIIENVKKEIPDAFYDKELVVLATGSDEEIAKVSAKFGLLTSPFSKTVRMKQNLDRLFGNRSGIPTTREQFSALQSDGYSYGYEQVMQAIRITQAATGEEVAAINDSILLTQALQDSGDKATGIVVSFSEIRATAARLLDAVKVIIAISKGISIAEMSEQIEHGLLPSFPVQRLRYIEHCLEGSNLLGISLTLKDRDNNSPHPYEVDPANYQELFMWGDASEVHVLRQWNLMIELSSAHPKDEVSFTEALALGIRNLAINRRTWAHCDHCGNEFPLATGQKRNIKEPRGRYCSAGCRNAASQKRYREKLKSTDTSTH